MCTAKRAPLEFPNTRLICWSPFTSPCAASLPAGCRLLTLSGGAAALRHGKRWQCPWSDAWQGPTHLHCWAVTLRSVTHKHKFSCFLFKLSSQNSIHKCLIWLIMTMSNLCHCYSTHSILSFGQTGLRGILYLYLRALITLTFLSD